MSNWLTLLEAVSNCFQNRYVFLSTSVASASLQVRRDAVENAYCTAKLEDSENPEDLHIDFMISIFFTGNHQKLIPPRAFCDMACGKRHQGAMPESERDREVEPALHLGAVTLAGPRDFDPTTSGEILAKLNHLDLWGNLLETVLAAMFRHNPASSTLCTVATAHH